MNKLLLSVTAFFLAIAAFYIIETGVERQEKAECWEWEFQANAIGMAWTAPDWSHQQCERYNIQLP